MKGSSSGSKALFNRLGIVSSLWDEGFKDFRMKTGSKALFNRLADHGLKSLG